MGKTTYILGAGASANAIPVANKLRDKIPELIFALEKHKIETPQASEYLIDEYYQLIADLQKNNSIDEMLIKWVEKEKKWTEENSVEMKREDKHLFLKLEDLKRLICYLMLYGGWKVPVDYRYDVFIRSLLKNRLTLPEDISILTWNYDLQMEFALCKYRNKSVEEAQNLMQCIPRIGDLPEQIGYFNSDTFNPDIYSVIKMNGTAGLFSSKNGRMVKSYVSNYKKFISDNILEKINCWNTDPPIHDLMTHTAEPSQLRRNYIDCSKKATRSTETLVVIGYSFPHYNNCVDREILGGMKNLKRIIIQDLNPTCIKEKLLMIIPNQKMIIENKDTDYFYLPSECEESSA